ncbi:MAG: pantoate--beta-alanine ligase [Candidatus Omnitrophica bacterium]|nr:pantoate--beta-alanine ligase [Candidatus Omnitrophota bacterium]
MLIAEKKLEIKEIVKNARSEGRTIGLVPTMGYLHKGHVSLINRAKMDGCFTVVSIFVNPLQFGPTEDFEKYPRDIERDIEILKQADTDVAFIPSISEMYHNTHLTQVDVSILSEKLEGVFRPGHFKGVCTVVAKLFNIIRPDRAYFGWKDAQQLIIIRKMVADLDFNLEIVPVPTVREDDGLAASSRNVYLSDQDRKKACVLSKALHKIRKMVELDKITDVRILLEESKKIIETENVELQYIEAVDLETLKPVTSIKKNTGILAAIKVGNVRLIDNVIWE